MERNEGRWKRPGEPIKEQGRRQKEKIANNSPASPVEQKLPNKISTPPAGKKEIERDHPGGAVFDCAVPEVIHSPFHIRRMLQDEIITEEQAHEEEQRWQEALKTMSKRSLEGEARWCEMMRERFTKHQKQEEVQEIEQQLEVIREQLRQRATD
jgi:hypothetical protein